MKHVISLFDLTGNMVAPWRDAGYKCWIVDKQHKTTGEIADGIVAVSCDLSEPWVSPVSADKIAAVFAFPPCTDIAVSGARWFKGKGLRKLAESIVLFAAAAEFCEWSGSPYMIENPISTISTHWRKPDYTFHPFEYAGLHPEDNYTKKTCLWTGGGFVMPSPIPLEGSSPPDDRIHQASPGPSRANFRSATPTGFAKAVFSANWRP